MHGSPAGAPIPAMRPRLQVDLSRSPRPGMTRSTSQTLFLARRALAMLAIAGVQAAGAQIPASEFAARRDSLAARIDSGVVVAFGGRTPVSDFGPFYQLAAFHYLTNFDEPDAAFVMVA